MQVSPKFHANAERMIEHGRASPPLPRTSRSRCRPPRGCARRRGTGGLGHQRERHRQFHGVSGGGRGRSLRARPGPGAEERRGPDPPPSLHDPDGGPARRPPAARDAKEQIAIDPGYLAWAGIAVFKRAHEIFKERGFRSSPPGRGLSASPPLVAAHRTGGDPHHALPVVEAVRGLGHRGGGDPRPAGAAGGAVDAPAEVQGLQSRL